jgi:hypothetical protein
MDTENTNFHTARDKTSLEMTILFFVSFAFFAVNGVFFGCGFAALCSPAVKLFSSLPFSAALRLCVLCGYPSLRGKNIFSS